jgi:hypothetical protein
VKPLSEMVRTFVEEGREALPLLSAVQRSIDRVTSRYPDAYFELGQRTPESVSGLADRVFTICARVEKGRFPFSGRAPFRAYVDEDFEDSPIRYHTFYAKLSITRELLRDDYAFNIRRNPVLRWRDELHRAVGRTLKETCQPEGDAPGAHRRWVPTARRPGVVRSIEDVQRRLRSHTDKSLPSIVPLALKLAGQSLSHSQLTNLLAGVLEGPPPETEPEDTDGGALPDQLAIRRAVTAAWNALRDEERMLIAALARGDDYDTLIATVPAFRDRSSVSRAVSRCNQQFVAQVLNALGHPPVRPDATPRALIERIIHVLLPMLPELEKVR